MVTASLARGAGQPSSALAMNFLDSMATECFAQLCQKSPKDSMRKLIAAGDLSGALDMIQAVQPELLKDLRLMFRLHKQKFIEILRGAISSNGPNMQGLSEAVACARSQLAPMALDAYPEAYTEFKQVLQLLVYAGAPAGCPAECEATLSDAARQELAEVVYQTSMETLGQHEPQLVLLLTYLLHLHSNHRHLLPSCQLSQGTASKVIRKPSVPGVSNGSELAGLPSDDPAGSNADGQLSLPRVGSSTMSNGSGSSGAGRGAASTAVGVRRGREDNGVTEPCNIAELCDTLLLPGCDAAPLRDESFAVASFKETDIQALVLCAGSSRRDAIAALAHTHNKLWPACQAELRRRHINKPLLLELVSEYCADRGLDVSTCSSQGAHSQQPAQRCDIHTGGQEGLSSMLQESQGVQEGDTVMDGCEGAGAHSPAPKSSNKELDTLTGPRGLMRLNVRRSASSSPPAKLHCCSLAHADGTTVRCAERVASGGGTRPQSGPMMLARLRETAEVEGPEAFHAAVESAVPGFWEQHPGRHLDLWAAAFGARLAAGDVQGALAVARTHMAPLAEAHASLQPTLKAAMAMLIPGVPAASNDADHGQAGHTLPQLATVVSDTVALLSSTHLGGGHNTRLVKLLQELLTLHRSWLRSERVSDPFQQDIGITALCTVTSPAGTRSSKAGTSGPQGSTGGAAPTSQQGGAEGVQGPPVPHSNQDALMSSDVDDDDDDGRDWAAQALGLGHPAGPAGGAAGGGGGVSEQEVQRLMEILAIQRSQAVTLLSEYGDVENAVNSAFG